MQWQHWVVICTSVFTTTVAPVMPCFHVQFIACNFLHGTHCNNCRLSNVAASHKKLHAINCTRNHSFTILASTRKALRYRKRTVHMSSPSALHPIHLVLTPSSNPPLPFHLTGVWRRTPVYKSPTLNIINVYDRPRERFMDCLSPVTFHPGEG